MNKKTFVKKSYDKTASFYETQYKQIQKNKFNQTLKKIGDPAIIVDIGCGTSLILEHKTLNKTRYIGVDFSTSMIKEAKKKKHPFKELIIADSENIPLRSKTINNIVSFTMLQNLPDYAAFLKEVKRITVQRARVLLTTLKKTFKKNKFEKESAENNLKIVEEEKLQNSEDIAIQIINI